MQIVKFPHCAAFTSHFESFLSIVHCSIWVQETYCSVEQNVEITEFFPSLRCYVKSILRITKVKIRHFYTFRSSKFWYLWIFSLYERCNLPNQQNAEPLKWPKMQFCIIYILQNWFHVKCCTFHTVKLYFDFLQKLRETFEIVITFCRCFQKFWLDKLGTLAHVAAS